MIADVLVVDDEDIVRDLILEILAHAGIHAVGAASTEEALRFLACNDVALVLTDVVMPHEGGLELLADLRRTRPGLPVVVCTGAATPETVDHAHRAGAAAILAKPFSHQELIAAVRSVVGESDRPAAYAGAAVEDECAFAGWKDELLGERRVAR